jgi:hypothetical protein
MVKEMPGTVVRALLDDQEFVEFVGHPVLGYGDLGSFRHQDIVSALKEASLSNGQANLLSRNGSRFVLERLSDGKGATLSGGGVEGRLISEFGLLDPQPENRLAALAAAEGTCWPSLSSAEKWRCVLMGRPLGEIEFAHLISDVREAPSQFLAALEVKWTSGAQLDAAEFFPTSIAYHSALAGPPPEAGTMDEWIADTLMPDLRRGVERSVVDGLRRALALNVDLRLSPVKLVEDVSDEELLHALGGLATMVSPFALLGVLEIALARSGGDGEFAVLASDALDRLFGEKSKTNRVDASWRMLPALVRACMGRFASAPELCGRPPYWRRLAAHAHANVLIELLDAQDPNVDRFVDWMASIVVEGEVAAHLLDLMEEPLWRAWDISPRQMRASVVARLISAKAALGEIGLGAMVDSAADAMKKEAGQLDAERPGPMVSSGARMSDAARIGATDDVDVSEVFSAAADELELNPLGEAWKGFSVACRLLQFDEGLRAKLAAVVGRMAKSEGDVGTRRFLEALLMAAEIGATQPDEAIAQKVAETLVGAAGSLHAEVDVATGFRVLVVAAGAIRGRDGGMEWLAERVSEFAFNIPRGLPCRRLLFELDNIQPLLPIKDRRLGRARKIASAGAT